MGEGILFEIEGEERKDKRREIDFNISSDPPSNPTLFTRKLSF